MLKTINKPIQTLGVNVPMDLPRQCPLCGGYGAPSRITYSNAQIPSTNKHIINFIYMCHNCDMYFYMFHEVSLRDPCTSNLIGLFPSPKPTDLPDFMKAISTRASALYHGSENALNNGFIDLAGTGFRNCIEILIKDFAVAEFKVSPSEFKGKSLFQIIDEYLPNMKLKNTSDVVRILGNGFTHYENEYTYDDLLTLRKYFDICIKLLEGEYLANHPELARSTPFSK